MKMQYKIQSNLLKFVYLSHDVKYIVKIKNLESNKRNKKKQG